MIEIDISQLYEFKACPLRYKFVHIDEIASQISSNDGMREAMRSTLSYFYYNLQDGVVVTMSDLKDKFASIWYTDTLYDIRKEGNRDKRKKELDAIGMLQTFHRKQKRNPDTVVSVNLDFRVPFGENFFVKGKIPLIKETGRGMEIVNFKTGTQRYDAFWQRTDMDITFQAMGYQSIFKKEIENLSIENLRSAQVYFPTRTKRDYQRLYKSIQMMRKTMDEGWYYPRESYHCDRCPAKELCMEWS